MEKDLCLTIPTQVELVDAGNLFLYKKPPTPKGGVVGALKYLIQKL
jgi:hypothetical protein